MKTLFRNLGAAALSLMVLSLSAQENGSKASPSTQPTLSFVETGQQLNRLACRGVALGDLNSDGFVDVFVVNVSTPDGQGSRVYFGDGKGYLTDSGQQLSDPLKREGRPAIGEVNGDGYLDVVTGNLIWINDGRGHFAAHPELIEAAGTKLNGPVGLADLNGDGSMDLVAVSDWKNLRIYFNDGKGHLRDTGQKLGSGIVGSMALGDVNGDGAIDVLSAGWKMDGDDFSPTRVWVNDGKGHFSDGGSIYQGKNHVHGIAVGDLNGDGSLDVVLAFTTPGEAGKVFFNDGKGHFRDSGQILAHRWAHSVVLGDLDGDGSLDVFFACGEPKTGTPNEAWLNDGKGNFSDSSLRLGNAFSWDVALGDLNGDRRLDAVVGNLRIAGGTDNQPVFGGVPLEVWLNTTPSTTARSGCSFTDNGQKLGSGDSWYVRLADLNGDGFPDAYFEGAVWLNDGKGHFTKSEQSFGPANRPAYFADLNGDGFVDAVCDDFVYLNNGKNGFGKKSPLHTDIPMYAAHLADLNGDGAIDIIVAGRYEDRILLNDGKGNFRDTHLSLGGWGLCSYAVSDVNGDGVPDVFVNILHMPPPNMKTAKGRLWLGDGHGGFVEADHAIEAKGGSGVIMVDLNGDKASDLLIGAAGGARVYINDGKGRFADSGQKLGTGVIVAGDFNGDGQLDAFFADGAPTDDGKPNTIWLNDGKGHFTDSGLRLGNANSLAAQAADLNGDGKPDLFVANIKNVITKKGDGFNEVWLNTSVVTRKAP